MSIFYKDGVITSRTIHKRLRLNDADWSFNKGTSCLLLRKEGSVLQKDI